MDANEQMQLNSFLAIACETVRKINELLVRNEFYKTSSFFRLRFGAVQLKIIEPNQQIKHLESN